MCYVWPYNWWCKRITSILKSIHQCVKVKIFKCWSCNGGIWTVEWTITEHLQCHKKCALDRTIHQTFLSLSCEMFLLLMKVTKKKCCCIIAHLGHSSLSIIQTNTYWTVHILSLEALFLALKICPWNKFTDLRIWNCLLLDMCFSFHANLSAKKFSPS